MKSQLDPVQVVATAIISDSNRAIREFDICIGRRLAFYFSENVMGSSNTKNAFAIRVIKPLTVVIHSKSNLPKRFHFPHYHNTLFRDFKQCNKHHKNVNDLKVFTILCDQREFRYCASIFEL
uniref:Uncharacterized protein n=1 Tax=Glossina pallidipes TaxID=7398 RepID=A0A1A9ZF36_GLOPL